MLDDGLCDWKMVPLKDYKIGAVSPRCGEPAKIKMIRDNRKKDLYLCSHHHEVFLSIYGDTLPSVEVSP